jgi:hypothetical protein
VELTPKNGVGCLLLPRRDLVKKCCNELMEDSQAVSGRNSTVSAYWRGPKGSGKTTFLHLMGREMQDRDCQVFYLNNAADFNKTDRTFVKSLSENRSEYENTVVVMIDEVPGGVGKGFWVTLLKECKGVIVIGVGVPALDSSSPVHFECKNNPHELYIAYHFQSELNELVDELLRHFPENTREQLIPFCEVVNSFTGGHMFPTLKLCEHFLQIPDWPDHYEKALRSSSLVKTEAYIEIRKRCFDAALPSLNTFVRFLQHNPTADDVVKYEKLGLWDSQSDQFLSSLYFNLLMNFVDNNTWKKSGVAMLPADASSEDKIEFIIEQGLVLMENQDFSEPYAGGWSHEDRVGNMWALGVRQRVPSMYVSGQTQTKRPPRNDGAVNKDGSLRKNMGGEPRVDFVFNGSTDVAIELLLTGVQTKSKDKKEVNKHSLRFDEAYKRWKNSCALFTFQLTGGGSDIIVPKNGVLNYTFVYEENALYKGNMLLKHGAVSKLRTPPHPGVPNSSSSSPSSLSSTSSSRPVTPLAQTTSSTRTRQSQEEEEEGGAGGGAYFSSGERHPLFCPACSLSCPIISCPVISSTV